MSQTFIKESIRIDSMKSYEELDLEVQLLIKRLGYSSLQEALKEMRKL